MPGERFHFAFGRPNWCFTHDFNLRKSMTSQQKVHRCFVFGGGSRSSFFSYRCLSLKQFSAHARETHSSPSLSFPSISSIESKCLEWDRRLEWIISPNNNCRWHVAALRFLSIENVWEASKSSQTKQIRSEERDEDKEFLEMNEKLKSWGIFVKMFILFFFWLSQFW